MSGIEWTDETWNPVRGCTHISPGCENCYAARMGHRFDRPGGPYEGLTRATGHGLRWNGNIMLVGDQLAKPLHWRKPRLVFVNSMSDVFHELVPTELIQEMFYVMKIAEQHTFQILTKRSERLVEMDGELDWPANVWMGVSVESADYLHRIDHLRMTGARIKFVSAEPLLGRLAGFDPTGIDWVIVGGESGPGARPMELDWAREIRDRCVDARTAYFLKQLGGVRDKRGGEDAVLDGRRWTEYPEPVRNG